jgi:choline/carnitine/betaine transport
MHPVVFPIASVAVLGLLITSIVFPSEQLQATCVSLRNAIGAQFGWLYVASMSWMLVLATWLGLGPYRKLKLGRPDEQPEFSRLGWFAMLFSAGMGIGLLFFSVAEPISHFQDPPPGFADGLDPSRLALAVTIFHWGFHPWALYAVVGLCLAMASFRYGRPLSFRSLLFPLLGKRVWGGAGDLIDALAIIATLTGVATSLGIGAKQVNAGLAFLMGLPSSPNIQLLLIAGITFVATISVVLGLDAGIRRLSELNMGLAALLMLAVILGGGLISFLASTVENIGGYLQVLPFSAFRTGAFSGAGQRWLSNWTVFYWAWWISWSPFVGMFIARISRGRTIGEYIAGTVLIPTAVGIVWFTAFGSTTLRQHIEHSESHQTASQEMTIATALPSYWVALLDDQGDKMLDEQGRYLREQRSMTAVEYLSAPIVSEDGQTTIRTLPTVLFALIDGLFPQPAIKLLVAGIATLCIVLFFVTSSDSASMVIDIIASGGNPNPPVGTRLFWAISEGLVAGALLVAGGLDALQAAAIATALPLLIILLLACYALLIDLRRSEGPDGTKPSVTKRLM